MRADHTLGLRNSAAAHAELAKTHADQRRNRGAVAAHFAADAERFSSGVKNCADMLDQAQQLRAELIEKANIICGIVQPVCSLNGCAKVEKA